MPERNPGHFRTVIISTILDRCSLAKREFDRNANTAVGASAFYGDCLAWRELFRASDCHATHNERPTEHLPAEPDFCNSKRFGTCGRLLRRMLLQH
jgi:hypothetical protein